MTSILKMWFYCLFIVFKLSLSTFNYISFDKNSRNVFELNYCWAWVFCHVIIDMTWQWMVFPLVLSCWWWSKLTTHNYSSSSLNWFYWIEKKSNNSTRIIIMTYGILKSMMLWCINTLSTTLTTSTTTSVRTEIFSVATSINYFNQS